MRGNLIVYTIIVLFLYGCNSNNSDGSLKTAKLVDSAVAGVAYSSPSSSGFTSNNGSFTYKQGELTTFKIGAATIGSISSIPQDNVVLVQDLVKIARTQKNTASINIARFLQSLDEDDNLSNGIEISQRIKSNITNNIDIQTASISQIDALVSALGKSLVSEDKALLHLLDTTSQIVGTKLASFSNTSIVNSTPNTDSTSTPDSNPTSVTVDIKVIDGYIKNASVVDNIGNTASYQGNGVYRFSVNPSYPIKASGGQLEDTNSAFDINLSAQSGSKVISPITSFIGNDSTIRTKLAVALNKSDDMEEFEVDYVSINDLNLSKISQLFYLSLKDDSLKATFTNTLRTNNSLTNLDDIFTAFKTDLQNSSYSGKRKMKYLLNKVSEYSANVSGMEQFIQNYKDSLINSNQDGNTIILRTGQTLGHTPGDDGSLENGTPRSYTDNTNGTITDNAAELIWQKEDDNITKNWVDANSYCENLSLGGSSNWRLPSIEELVQLSDKGDRLPSINPIFTGTDSSNYWSFSSSATNSSFAWSIDFTFGVTDTQDKVNTYYVRCVQSLNM